MFNTNQDRREAVKKIIQHLPRSIRPYLDDLFRAAETDPSQETELYSALRSTLNTLSVQSALPRRSFLQIAGLVVTGGLAPLLYPEKAHAWQAWTGFWQNIQTNSYVANPSSTDPYWDYVVLLMNFDGSNGSTVFADESNVGKNPTLAGSPYIDTSSSPYSGGKGSGRFNGSTDFVSVPASSDLVFSGDFTIETWIYPRSNSGGQAVFSSVAIGSSWNGTGGMFLANNAGILEFRTNAIDLTAGSSNLSINTWYHVAVVRSGSGSNNIKVYLNGSLLYQGTDTATLGSASVAPAIGIVDQASGSRWFFNGSLADLRIYNGVAKYTAAFTPATAPIGLGSANDPNWGYCVLACPFENTLKDMSGKAFSRSGTPQLSTSQKKFGNASASFDGSSYLQTPDSTDFDFANIDFTIEGWVYLNAGTSAYTFVTQNSSANDFSWRFGTRYGSPNSGVQKLHLQRSGYLGAIGTAAIPTGAWTHVAVSVSGTTIRFFINGVQDTIQTSFSYSDCMANSSNPLRIGYDTEGGLNGYIDSLRITQGYARYTSSFTPPTAAFPVGRDETVDPFWSNTVLAMHMDDLTDATGRHATTSTGSIALDTSSQKFGTKCYSQTGSGALDIVNATGDLTFADNFTIELWMKTTTYSADTGNRRLWAAGANADGTPLQLHLVNSGKLLACNGTTNFISGNRFVADGSWHHVALVRSSGTLNLLIDGISDGTYSLSSQVSTGSTYFRIGAVYNDTTTGRYSGYLDDLRITKGIARYSANFTPPTRAFATTAPLKSYTTHTWIWGSNTKLQAGVYGTQGVASSSNIPGTRMQACSWKDSSGNFWLFGGQGYDSAGSDVWLNDLWKYNPGTNQWTWISGSSTGGQSGTYGTKGTGSTSNIPGARFSSISWIDSSGILWLFGGYGRDSAGNGGNLNDLWKFNPTNSQWTWVSGGNTGTNNSGGVATYGTKGTGSTSNTPGGRNASISWLDSTGNLWLFGGLGQDSVGSNGYLNDLWSFNPSNSQWTWVSGANTINQSGTYGTQGTGNTSNIPGARYNSTALIDAPGNLWLFGGSGYDSAGTTGSINDLWKYSPGTGQWTWVSGSNTKNQLATYGTLAVASASNVPGGRNSHSSWIDANGCIYIFGGQGYDGAGSGYLNDLWKFDPINSQWTWIGGNSTRGQGGTYGTLGTGSSSNMPGGRVNSVTWIDSDGVLWLFGGRGNDSATSFGYLNDLWRFS